MKRSLDFGCQMALTWMAFIWMTSTSCRTSDTDSAVMSEATEEAAYAPQDRGARQMLCHFSCQMYFCEENGTIRSEEFTVRDSDARRAEQRAEVQCKDQISPSFCATAINPKTKVVKIQPGCVQSQAQEGRWQTMPGKAYDLAIGAGGDVWAIGTVEEGAGFRIFRWMQTGWIQVEGEGEKIAVEPNGRAWVVNRKREIWRWRSGNTWDRMPGLATDIAIGANGAIWVLGTDNHANGWGLWYWNGSDWEKLKDGSQAVKIAVDPKGQPWIVDRNKEVWRRVSGKWQKLNGMASDIAISPNGAAYVIGTDRTASGGGVWRYAPSTGEFKAVGGSGTSIAAGPSGDVWIADAQTLIWRALFNN
jgi:hypothetical protein